MVEYDPENPPVVKARVVTPKTVQIECPFCGKTHTHGRGDGRRGAHCAGRQFGMYEYIIKEEAPDNGN